MLAKSIPGSTIFAIVAGMFLFLLCLFSFNGLISLGCVFPVPIHVLLHLVGVVLFMGNMMVGPVWFLLAWYSGERSILRFSGKMLALTDAWITIPGLYLTVINGLCLAPLYGGLQAQAWIYQSLLLLFLMWLLTPPLIWIQEKMLRSIETSPFQSGEFKKYLYLWSIWGTMVMIPPAIIFYLMVTKPA